MLATTPTVDIDALYTEAQATLAELSPAAELQPLEPCPPNPSPGAMAIEVKTSDGTAALSIDAATEAIERFEPATAVEALIAKLGDLFEIASTGPVAVNDQAVGESESSFRAAIHVDGQAIGEFRFVVAASGDGSGGEPAADPDDRAGTEPLDAAAQTDPPGSEASPRQDEPTPPADQSTDLNNLASRLPNLAAVDMDVTVELGRVRLPIRELLNLASGSVVRLGTPIGDSFDILVNGKPAARGDLVVVGGKLAVRIRELLGIEA